MSASSTGFPAYVGDKKVWAARITGMHLVDIPGYPGCTTLTLGDVDKVTTIIADWVNANQPQIGGYLVVEDGPSQMIASFLPADKFSQQYRPEES